MAFSLRVLIISALIIGFCSSDDKVPEKTGVIQQYVKSQKAATTSAKSQIQIEQTTASEPASPESTSLGASATSDSTGPTSGSEPISPPVSATAGPVDTTSPSGSVTSSPVDATSPSGSVTSSPVDTTSPSGSVTSSPVEATSPSGSVTSSPVDPTSPSGSVTSSPVEATSPSGSVTSSPADPTSPPGSVTSGPVETSTRSGTSTFPDSSTPHQVDTTSQSQQTSPAQSGTTVAVTTRKPFHCHNGGTFNGINCICVLGFSGSSCEMAEAVVPGAFNRTVIINVVIRENYIPEYDNPSSNEYKTFVGDFLSEMKPKYQEVPFFKDIIVTGLSRGGPASIFDHTAEEIGEVKAKAFDFKESTDNVNVAHDVVLEVNNGNHTGQYKEGFQKVEEVIGNLLESGYVITSSTEETDVDEEGLCKRILQDSDIAEYFSNFTLENGTIVCRSRCDPEHNETIECHNKGTCSIFKGLGEICICENVNSIWYLGEDCSWPIQKVPFYAGLSVTLAVLLVAVVTLVAYAVVNKQKHTKKKDVKQKLVNQWLDDDYEWSRAASPIGKHGAKNGSVMYGNQQAPFTYGSNRFNPSERMFSLPQNLHTHDSSFPNPGYGTPAISPSPNTDFRFNLPMRILRPETRGSLDV